MESPPHLPEELATLILARLPPASALRFQNVCKSWRSIVSGPGFLERSILLQRKRRETSLIIAEARKEDYNAGILIDPSYTVLESPTSVSPTEFGQLPPLLNRIFLSDCVMMVGSCRGVVCLAGLLSGRCILWNPTTGESRDLHDHDSDQMYRNSSYSIGLGHFDGELKVVKISNTRRNCKEFFCVKAKIYKLSLGYWREISTAVIDRYGIELPYASDRYMVCWRDGNMYSWMTNVRDHITSTYSFIITSFDMSNDTFTSFSSAKVPRNYDSIGLLALNDMLASWCCNPRHQHQRDGTNMDIWVMDIWVMLQHGVVESWAKLWSIRVGPEPHWPKVIWNGGLVMKKSSEDRLLWCDLSNSPCIIQTLPVFAFSCQTWTEISKVVSFEKTRTSLGPYFEGCKRKEPKMNISNAQKLAKLKVGKKKH